MSIPKTVIIVEDKEGWQNILKEYIKNEFLMEIEIYPSFKEAEERLTNGLDYHLVILDLSLDESGELEDGFSLAKYTSLIKKVPVIIVSAHDQKYNIKRAFKECEVISFISKKDFDKLKFLNDIQDAFNVEKAKKEISFSLNHIIEKGIVNIQAKLDALNALEFQHINESLYRLDKLDNETHQIIEKLDDVFNDIIKIMTSEGKDGPRLFSFEPIDRSIFNPRGWIKEKFRFTLWCEHSRIPLPLLNINHPERGVCEIEIPRGWFEKAAPYLKILSSALSLVLPIAASSAKMIIDDKVYKSMEKQLELGKEIIEAFAKSGEKLANYLTANKPTNIVDGLNQIEYGIVLNEFHSWLKQKDPTFGGLVRVLNNKHEFLWIHEQFVSEYPSI